MEKDGAGGLGGEGGACSGGLQTPEGIVRDVELCCGLDDVLSGVGSERG